MLFTPALAREAAQPYLVSQDGSIHRGLPLPSAVSARATADTLFFGYYDGTSGLAIQGETWTFDHGAPDPFEGWYGTDLTDNAVDWWRHIDAGAWSAGGNGVAAPVLVGSGSAWVGAFEDEADGLCWTSGLGYGDLWCQRLTSPPLPYAGGGATLRFEYFNDTEPDFDYTNLLLLRPDGERVPLLPAKWTGPIGLAVDHPVSPPEGVTYEGPIANVDVGAFGSFQLVFEMTSDAGWSDEGGLFSTEYGPFALDDLTLTGATVASFDFESSLQAWTPGHCAGVGSLLGVRDVALYVIQDACACDLAGNVLEFHDDDLEHPQGQWVEARSNPVDLTGAAVQLGGAFGLTVGAQWDQYSELPFSNGVFYRPGWTYYPYVCPQTGATGWSPRVGQGSFFIVGNDPLCARHLSSATGSGIPLNAEQVRFVYEIYASCDAFGVPPEDCSGVTNFTPILDNVQAYATAFLDAPGIAFETGRRFQDGFGQGGQFLSSIPGNADCTRNLNLGYNHLPVILEDVPQVNGPSALGRPWSARLHFRVVREGPGASGASFAPWRAWKLSTGVGVGPGGSFAVAVMDTFETSGIPAPLRNRYVGYFREDDPNNPSPGTELASANEIIVDNVPPGTKIEYFISAQFNDGTDASLLPDTTGGHFAEFEILPSWRPGEGPFPTARFPSILYVGAHENDGGARVDLVSDALAQVLGSPSADDLRNWDRYDYLDATGSWAAPMARVGSGNNGATLAQLAGYRGVILDTGRLDDAMWPEDFALLQEWLFTHLNQCGQALLVNGDGAAGTLLSNGGAGLLLDMGANLQASSYREAATGGGDANSCVQLDAASGAAYGTSNTASGSYTHDAWGNACPTAFDFDVLETVGMGVGNRIFTKIGSSNETSFAQVVTDRIDVDGHFRSVLDGVSWAHMSPRSGPLGDPDLECSAEYAGVVSAAADEIRSALEWAFEGDIPMLEGGDSCPPGDVDDLGGSAVAEVSRLEASVPNPFDRETSVRFTLGVAGRATVFIFDAGGRLVRRLVSEDLNAGVHTVAWDGRNERGHRLSQGIYWSQLVAPDGTESSRRLVILRD